MGALFVCAGPCDAIMANPTNNVHIDERAIVEHIENLRRDRGISIAELARRIDMDGKRLWYVLHAQREMRVQEFIKLCAFFGLGLGCFIDRATVERLRSSQPFRE